VRVVVYDKLERPQPLGSGLILQPVGLHVLDEIGVAIESREIGRRNIQPHAMPGFESIRRHCDISRVIASQTRL